MALIIRAIKSLDCPLRVMVFIGWLSVATYVFLRIVMK